MRFVPAGHQFLNLAPDTQRKILSAQEAFSDPVLASAFSLAEAAFAQVRLALSPPPEWRDIPASGIADRRYSDLHALLLKLQVDAGVPHHGAQLVAGAAAQRVHLLRAFHNPDAVIARTGAMVQRIVGDFPRTAADIERGRNPGDVLDPYILAATQHLICSGNFQQAITATVAHKVLMIVEGLLGHLHEDIVGEMRGNVRVPEPRGDNQHALDVATNPFPGADVMQPPRHDGDVPRFHQIKSKTGSAKGGDGIRLGQQLLQLQDVYGGEIYYDALIANTLRGHRSKGAVEKAAPGVVVLVGEAAFRSLTGSAVGPELLLRVYQAAFQEAAAATGYSLDRMTVEIFDAFAAKAEASGEGFLEAILHTATNGPPEQQDNRLFNEARTSRRLGVAPADPGRRPRRPRSPAGL